MPECDHPPERLTSLGFEKIGEDAPPAAARRKGAQRPFHASPLRTLEMVRCGVCGAEGRREWCGGPITWSHAQAERDLIAYRAACAHLDRRESTIAGAWVCNDPRCGALFQVRDR